MRMLRRVGRALGRVAAGTARRNSTPSAGSPAQTSARQIRSSETVESQASAWPAATASRTAFPDCFDVCPGYDDTLDCNENGVPDGCDIFEVGSSADINRNGVPDECECIGDLDGSGVVDAADLAILLGGWGPCSGCAADVDASGTVDGNDLAIVLGAWGACLN
jgi:hypothetical protein